jgi:TPP-dependent pyruvate/acetoin dehydrogenase alpha subunit
MTACIGGGYAMAAGMAYAMKQRGEKRVVVLSYGDGGYNQSDAHPAMVIAASWKLPLVFHVPYNGWAQYTPSDEFNPTKSVAARGAAYNIPADSVGGNDIEVVYETAQKAYEHARSGRGPYLMEYRTYRMGLHFSGDSGEYLDNSEIAKWAARDPIKLGKEMLLKKGAITESDFEKISQDIDKVVEDSCGQAMSLPYPDAKDMYAGVYAAAER